MITEKKDLREQGPWVLVDRNTWQILQLGTFEDIHKTKKEGHTMTISIYNQIMEERYDRNTIEQIETGRMADQI